MAQTNGDQSDVVAIPTELSVKHPLQNAWVLWFDNPVKRLGAKDWSQNLKKASLILYLWYPVVARWLEQGVPTTAVIQMKTVVGLAGEHSASARIDRVSCASFQKTTPA